MQPTLAPGDDVFVAPKRQPRVGDIVVAGHPYTSDVVLIKRVSAMTDSHVELASDDPAEGTDSRTFGPLPRHHLIGVVIARL